MPSTTRKPTTGATARSSTGKKPPSRPTSRRAAQQPPAPRRRRWGLAVAAGAAVVALDGGRIWTDLTLPTGTSAATFSADGTTLYAGALDGDTARAFASTDAGTTWTAS